MRQRWQLELYAGTPFGVYVLRSTTPTVGNGSAPGRATASGLGPGASSARPTVLAIHGHGYGSRQLVGLNADGTVDTARADGHAHFAESLARLGANVVVPDVLGFGQRVSAADQDPAETSACARLSSRFSALGLSLAGARTAELVGVVDSLPALGLDATAPLGTAGHSGGSLLAMLLALADRRVSAIALSGYVNTFAASILAMRHCPCNYVPGLLRAGEMPELLAALAPRPLLVEGGTADPIFPIAGFRTAVGHLREAYAAAGAADAFLAVEHGGDHRVDGGTIHPALVAALGN
ncbi:alpha/beta hydrolase family protein [Zhihengliuella alba]|uniref:alpha/beta hydrolase family protein n=1 Tax=Zhihengliuella alba TaxID=547018 RepID=UPI0031EB4BF5